MNYKASRNLLILGSFVSVFLFYQKSTLLLSLGILIITVSLFQAHLFYRCPYCHHAFGPRDAFSSFCSYCGKSLS